MAFLKRSDQGRLAFLDWTRGLAAFIMLQGHAFHSFTKPELRDGGPYIISQFVGGMPPAMFLFLVGVTLSFLLDSRERAGASPSERVVAGLKRAGYLLALSWAFRIQMWIFGLPFSNFRDLLKVDILNAMALAVALMSVMAVFRTVDRVRLCAVLGVAIAAASPLVSRLNWAAAPELLRNYFAPDYASFAFFPWGAFVAFGMSAGAVIRIAGKDQLERAAQWSAIVGFCLIFSCQYFSGLPYSIYSKSEFWLDSPWLIFIKLGVILVMLSFAWLWTRHQQGWSWIRQFGMTSLLVYWVHVELVYGRWFWFWKENLTVGQTLIAAVGVIVLMLLLSTARLQWKNWRLLTFSLGWYFFTAGRVRAAER